MNLPNNTFTHAIAEGKQQIGLWVGLTSNFAANVVAPSGYDWVVVDMEHSPNSITSILGQLQVFEASSTTAIVRPEWNDPVLVKRLLDLGAPGLLFPMVQSVEEAELAVSSTRYPPRGIRGVSGSMRGNKYGRITDYNDRIEDETTVIIQLETTEAISHAEEIASVDGVNGIFFGPADIAANMGMLGKPNDPAVWDVIMPAAKKLMAMGMPVGTLVMDVDFAAKLMNEGFTFVACGTDASILANGSDALLATMKEKTA
jgi:4-hydroxy-2-oxoheptanedioate aldolase